MGAVSSSSDHVGFTPFTTEPRCPRKLDGSCRCEGDIWSSMISSIPEQLAIQELKVATVMADAMGYQKGTARGVCA